MYVIAGNYESELIVKNSHFITILKKIDSNSNIEKIITDLKLLYPDATHYCYAYIQNDKMKSSDDGEPSGTAGIPILKVLEANNLTNILAVVIRYFGGIKLGANGLIRAYTKGVANSIKEVKLLPLVDGLNIDIIFDYQRLKEIDYLLKDQKINKKAFDTTIKYNLDIETSFLEYIINLNIDYHINKQIKIEKTNTN